MPFGRKEPEPAKVPYTLQVLTPEYLIEGTAAVDSRIRSYLLTESGNVGLTALEAVTITPVHVPSPVPKSVTAFAVVRNSVVMLIPRAPEGSFEYAGWRENYTGSYQGRLYAGPFVVEGTWWVLRNGSFDDQVPATDVKVSSMREGSGWPGLDAPVAFINLACVYGWEPA